MARINRKKLHIASIESDTTNMLERGKKKRTLNENSRRGSGEEGTSKTLQAQLSKRERPVGRGGEESLPTAGAPKKGGVEQRRVSEKKGGNIKKESNRGCLGGEHDFLCLTGDTVRNRSISGE